MDIFAEGFEAAVLSSAFASWQNTRLENWFSSSLGKCEDPGEEEPTVSIGIKPIIQGYLGDEANWKRREMLVDHSTCRVTYASSMKQLGEKKCGRIYRWHFLPERQPALTPATGFTRKSFSMFYRLYSSEFRLGVAYNLLLCFSSGAEAEMWRQARVWAKTALRTFYNPEGCLPNHVGTAHHAPERLIEMNYIWNVRYDGTWSELFIASPIRESQSQQNK